MHRFRAMTRTAYGQAYQAGFNRTVRFLISRGARPDDAREAAQSAWARGWERQGQLRDEKILLRWVNTIAFNVYRASVRRETGTEALPELAGNFEIDIAAIDVARLLKFCSPCERTLFEQQIRGATTGEMAHFLGVTETAVRIRLMRARRTTRLRMEEHASQRREHFRLRNARNAA